MRFQMEKYCCCSLASCGLTLRSCNSAEPGSESCDSWLWAGSQFSHADIFEIIMDWTLHVFPHGILLEYILVRYTTSIHIKPQGIVTLCDFVWFSVTGHSSRTCSILLRCHRYSRGPIPSQIAQGKKYCCQPEMGPMVSGVYFFSLCLALPPDCSSCSGMICQCHFRNWMPLPLQHKGSPYILTFSLFSSTSLSCLAFFMALLPRFWSRDIGAFRFFPIFSNFRRDNGDWLVTFPKRKSRPPSHAQLALVYFTDKNFIGGCIKTLINYLRLWKVRRWLIVKIHSFQFLRYGGTESSTSFLHFVPLM